jgi:ankyrin repeat protein
MDVQDKIGRTALMWASKYGKKGCVGLLLGANAGVDVQDKNGRTALMYASVEGKEE